MNKNKISLIALVVLISIGKLSAATVGDVKLVIDQLNTRISGLSAMFESGTNTVAQLSNLGDGLYDDSKKKSDTDEFNYDALERLETVIKGLDKAAYDAGTGAYVRIK